MNKGLLAPLASFYVLAAAAAQAQSLHVQAPAPLASGLNQGTVDSFVGPHFWSFTANPGRFRVVFSGAGPQEGFSVGGRAQAAMAFAPSSRSSHFTEREGAQGTVFEGVVDHPQKVVVEVIQAPSPLVRQTTDYTLAVSGEIGSISAGNGAGRGGPAPISGVYMSKNGFGAVRFLPDGEVISSNGDHGTWTAFDPSSQIYSVVLGGTRMTVTLVPARGLIETGNHNILFEMQR